MSADVGTARESVDARRRADVLPGGRIPSSTPVSVGVTVGLLALAGLLTALVGLVGLAPMAAVIGSVCGVVLAAGLVRAASAVGSTGLGRRTG